MGSFLHGVLTQANAAFWFVLPTVAQVSLYALISIVALFWATLFGYAAEGLFTSIMNDFARRSSGPLSGFAKALKADSYLQKMWQSRVMAAVVLVFMAGHTLSFYSSVSAALVVTFASAFGTMVVEHDRLLGGNLLQHLVSLPIMIITVSRRLGNALLRAPLRWLSR